MKLTERKLRRIIRRELSEASRADLGTAEPLGKRNRVAYEFGGVTTDSGQLVVEFKPVNGESASADIPENYVREAEEQAKQVTPKVSRVEMVDYGGVTKFFAYIDGPALTQGEIKKFNLTELVL